MCLFVTGSVYSLVPWWIHFSSGHVVNWKTKKIQIIVLVSYQRLLIPVLVLVIYSMIYHKNLFVAALKENSVTLGNLER